MHSDQTAMDCDFIPGQHGKLFITWTHPVLDKDIVGSVLFIPPFAEEMNKCRRMVALQARALARNGLAVLVFDLPGCGDSYGEFADASWIQWLNETGVCIRWLQERSSAPLYLWACRMGALLATEIVAERGVEAAGLLFWQPVTDGRSIITGFLRVALAAELGASRDCRETVGELRERLRCGGIVEIAGYELNGNLAGSIESTSLEIIGHPSARTCWLEVTRRAVPKLLPASHRVIEAWRKSGAIVDEEVVQGDAFWSTVEVVEAPALIERSSSWIVGRPS